MTTEQKWFRRWFHSMPLSWQSGLWEAIQGGAFCGNLEPRINGESAGAVVFFVHPLLAARVEACIEAAASVPATAQGPG
jgi:hypothetical protein